MIVQTVDLRIGDEGVVFHQNEVAIGNQCFSIAFDHQNDGLTGHIQILDAFSVPRMLLAKDDFFQIDMLFLVVRSGAENKGIAGAEDHIAVGNDDPLITLDGGNQKTGGKTKALDRESCPGVLFRQMDFNEVDVFSLATSLMRLMREN